MTARGAILALCAVALTALAPPRAAADSGPRVKAETGILQGVESPDHAVAVYRGIPFARPPTGALRWRPPERALDWNGVRAANRFGAPCIQPAYPSQASAPSEDCLYLNVWAPQTERGGPPRPVMVWIHGGAFKTGAASIPAYEGSALARKGVVVVSINYRLGKFGFLAHPQLSAESPHHASGNYGLMDQVAALHWVQRNIAAFGGDPRNVTIFGQSAGGHSVSYLTAAPLAKGLFAKAIAQSGGGFAPELPRFGHTLRTLHAAEQSGLRLQARVHAADIAALRRIPARDIEAAPTADDDDMTWPILDGYVLPDTVERIFAEGRQNDVPTLAGYNSNEGISFPHSHTLAAYETAADRGLGARAQDYFRLYPAADDAAAEVAGEHAVRDNRFGWQTWTWARLQARTGQAPIWWYYFDMHPPVPAAPQAGAYHGAEIAYVFNTWLPARWPWRARDRRLGALMLDYWVNFARTGDPNGPGLPPWSRFDPARPERMVFDEAPSQRPPANLDHLAFWDSLAKQ